MAEISLARKARGDHELVVDLVNQLWIHRGGPLRDRRLAAQDRELVRVLGQAHGEADRFGNAPRAGPFARQLLPDGPARALHDLLFCQPTRRLNRGGGRPVILNQHRFGVVLQPRGLLRQDLMKPHEVQRGVFDEGQALNPVRAGAFSVEERSAEST
jgi:hypothetical protein